MTVSCSKSTINPNPWPAFRLYGSRSGTIFSHRAKAGRTNSEPQFVRWRIAQERRRGGAKGLGGVPPVHIIVAFILFISFVFNSAADS
jgi:hypothetical protein